MSVQGGEPSSGSAGTDRWEANQAQRAKAATRRRQKKQQNLSDPTPNQIAAGKIQAAQQRALAAQEAIGALWQQRQPLEEQYGNLVGQYGIDSDAVSAFIDANPQFSDTLLDSLVIDSILANQELIRLQNQPSISQPAEMGSPLPIPLPIPPSAVQTKVQLTPIQALIQATDGHWAGPENFYPPFTVPEFEAALAKARKIGGGINQPRYATIGDSRYVIKEVRPENTAGALYSDPGWREEHHYVEIPSPAQYETQAGVVGTQMAKLYGMGNIVADTYSFEHRGRQFSVSRMLEGSVDLFEYKGWDFDDEGRPLPSSLKSFSDDNLQDVVLTEYAVNDSDRRADNYRVFSETGDLALLDLDRCLQSSSVNMRATMGAFLYGMKAGGAGKAIIPKHKIEAVTAAEAQAVALMETYSLHAGIPGYQTRMQRLRQLHDKPGEVTLLDLGYNDDD